MKTMWKKFLAAALALVFIAALAACGAPASNENEEAQNTPVQPAQESPAPEESPELEEVPAAEEEEIPWPDALPLTFVFSSGAGGWFTELELQPDGSFTGSYHDSEMGEFAEDYPNGTVYVCEFSGRFEALSHPDENTWVLSLEELTASQTMGESWIEEGIRYVAATPYGVDGGTAFTLYAPETPTSGLSEQFLSWWPGRYEETAPATLQYWGLLNEATGSGFFTGA